MSKAIWYVAVGFVILCRSLAAIWLISRQSVVGQTRVPVEALAISPDGKRIVSGSFTVAKVWDAATGAELMTLPSNGSYGVAFSPDDKTIAVGSGDGNVILCESGPRPAKDGSGQSGESTQKVVD